MDCGLKTKVPWVSCSVATHVKKVNAISEVDEVGIKTTA